MLVEQLRPLASIIRHYLQQHPDGIGEYELLKYLQKSQQAGFPDVSLTASLPLFQMHFLLFHVLYQLQTEFHTAQIGELVINPLKIQLLPYQATQTENSLSEQDTLRRYYLDLSHLEKTTEQDVNQLLNQFWTRFHAQDKRQNALATLGLQEPVNADAIKYRYRQLVMQHHPDRGGDKQTLQTINEAMEILEKTNLPRKSTDD
ncbi:DnaJ-class molecular chaperone with C-terminal Zn finger domain [Beggiatoa alba B18LD]|uniref:DnaJ-class molecular chaperone with C-terminal Zn finger domain n=1 Tax=Beggiatoa alba B18LD TaxID=395493 RepID=I3CKU9_9GAMM|nr:DNA-J related domain-containing protein [Beggiatoa alba]EIJ44242.1 DnaJ-class molecular chaperone with C-terminal Zn finger domain [Beggiatoa alba B18LD]